MFRKSKTHLDEANEHYFEHQRFAFRYGLECIAAGLMAWIHGIVPACFETSASRKVKALAQRQRK